MTTCRRRLLEDLQLRGRAPRPHQCYVEAVKQLTQYYRGAPAQIRDDDRRPYFRFLLNEQPVAESPCRLPLYGSRFFYERTLQRPWPGFDLVRPRHPPKLPGVWSPREVRNLRALVVNPTARMCRQVIYACGLRRREGSQWPVSDIDSQRMLVRVRQGKGGQDRVVPLAPRVLALLRAYWQRQRPRPWLCPARPQQTPLPATTLQQTFKLVVRQSGIPKDAAIPTLRHA
jgi:site-specific recombinase XerD